MVKLLLVFGCGLVCAQKPAFEVASVKVNANPPRMGMGAIQYSPDRLNARGVSMWLLVRWAYGVGSFQIAGPVSMQEAPYYDIEAKAGGAVTQSQLRLMLQALLAERFHLAVHREKKEMPVTALVVAKGGAKLRASGGTFEEKLGAEAPLQFLGFDTNVHIQRTVGPDGRVRDSYTNMPMSVFAQVLELMASRTPYDKVAVVDGTGMRGRFDFAVVTEPRSPGDDGTQAEDPLTVYKRILPGQLGLALERRPDPVEVLVVDRVDRRPTGN